MCDTWGNLLQLLGRHLSSSDLKLHGNKRVQQFDLTGWNLLTNSWSLLCFSVKSSCETDSSFSKQAKKKFFPRQKTKFNCLMIFIVFSVSQLFVTCSLITSSEHRQNEKSQQANWIKPVLDSFEVLFCGDEQIPAVWSRSCCWSVWMISWVTPVARWVSL